MRGVWTILLAGLAVGWVWDGLEGARPDVFSLILAAACALAALGHLLAWVREDAG
jgi:hypothetical protein